MVRLYNPETAEIRSYKKSAAGEMNADSAWNIRFGLYLIPYPS